MSNQNENKVIHEKVSANFERSIAYLDNLMVVVCDFTNGPMSCPDPPHSHPHEQITFVAKGELTFFKGDQEFHLKEGDVISVPSGIPHCIMTLSSHVRLTDCFSPVRKDFIK
ncbi:MAG TPA: cupin domain-containing protein [Bacteroidales bacterium]|nr:cupin domain-containing protein [Bacteroidales bacterium]HPT22144.1 cupin domain-containing protein [Bacteroidales bacterium]